MNKIMKYAMLMAVCMLTAMAATGCSEQKDYTKLDPVVAKLQAQADSLKTDNGMCQVSRDGANLVFDVTIYNPQVDLAAPEYKDVFNEDLLNEYVKQNGFSADQISKEDFDLLKEMKSKVVIRVKDSKGNTREAKVSIDGVGYKETDEK